MAIYNCKLSFHLTQGRKLLKENLNKHRFCGANINSHLVATKRIAGFSCAFVNTQLQLAEFGRSATRSLIAKSNTLVGF